MYIEIEISLKLRSFIFFENSINTFIWKNLSSICGTSNFVQNASHFSIILLKYKKMVRLEKAMINTLYSRTLPRTPPPPHPYPRTPSTSIFLPAGFPQRGGGYQRDECQPSYIYFFALHGLLPKTRYWVFSFFPSWGKCWNFGLKIFVSKKCLRRKLW